MSLTLHTTEIWLNTHTDSGGMKDRTHGIFLQKDSGRESVNTTLCGSQCRSGFPVILNWAEGPLGLHDGWGSPRGWWGGGEWGRDGTRASPLLFSYRLIVRLSETGPVLLWLQAFRLRFKPSTLARQHRSDPDEGFVIATAPPSSAPDTTDKLTICPPQSHTPRETLWSSTLFLFHEFKTQNASHVGFTSQLLQSDRLQRCS